MTDAERSAHDHHAAIDALTQMLVVWDEENFRHCQRTSEYAAAIARELGLDAEAVEPVRVGSLLHDIGKVGVDLRTLKKPGPLDDAEWAQVHAHPGMGESILLRALPRAIADCAGGHHEQPDGKGYPHGLTEEQIPEGARVCRVADVFDALTTAQSYRPALSLDEALAELRAGAGTRYSAPVVAALESLIAQRQADRAA